MKLYNKILIYLLVLAIPYNIITSINSHYSIKNEQKAQKYQKLYNDKYPIYSHKQSDLSYYSSGLHIKTIAQKKYGLIEANDNPDLVTYSKVYKDKKDNSITVIMDLFTTSLSAEELKVINPY